MPLYEYQCDACGHRFETIQKFSDPPLTICPKCGSSVRKLIASPAFQFKGTGWYITDYAKKKDPAGDKGADKGPEKAGEKGASESGAAADKGESKKAESASKSDAPPAPSPSSKT